MGNVSSPTKNDLAMIESAESLELLERRAAAQLFTRTSADASDAAGGVARRAPVFRPLARARQAKGRCVVLVAPLPALGSDWEAPVRQRLLQAVRDICAGNAPGSLEELYRHVGALCAAGRGEWAYRELLQELQAQLSQQLASCEDLQALVEVWSKLCRAFVAISQIYGCLDHELQVCAAAKRLFRELLLKSPRLQEAKLAVARLLTKERRQEVTDRDLARSLVALLRDLDFYEELEPLLLKTADFYGEECAKWRQHGLAEYLRLSEEHLQMEEQRCRFYDLEAKTWQLLLELLRQEILAKRAQELLDSFEELMSPPKVQDLKRLYQQYKDIDALPLVRKAFTEAVRKAGTRIMGESKGVVPELVGLLTSMQEVVAIAFEGDCVFAIALKEAFEGFLNANPNHAAKLLARHVDALLRGDVERPQSSQASIQFSPTPQERTDDLEALVTQALQIFRYLSAKDAFEAFFKKDLAKRLLKERSGGGRDGEVLTAQLLREECGAAYTAGIEGMFHDMEISKVLAEVFESQAKELQEAPLGFGVSVLTLGRWPPQPSFEVQMPQVLQRLMSSFSGFYAAQHRGRALRWCHAWGSAVLRFSPAPKAAKARKELLVSHLQALVLLLFNSADSLSYEAIRRATGIPELELQLTLQSLTLHKSVKLLLKGSKEKEVEGDSFTFNSNFTHKLYRITVSQITPKEQQQEEAAVEERVVGSRQHELDAVIIRIMKSKKRSEHQELLSEVLASLRFPAESADIKRRVESLIEREYLERLPNEGITSYAYLA
ncbi:unnamed protein product [Effrenium voratum]|nr:unnamed protein product [Effrenium voratum]